MRERIARPFDNRGALGLLALAVVYHASVHLGLQVATVHGNVSPVWPPTGVAIAGLLVLGVRAWPALFVGGCLAVLPTPAPTLAALGMVTGNTLEAVAAALLLRRLGFREDLGRIRDVVALGLGAAAGCTLVSTAVGVLSLCLTGAAPWADAGRVAWTWWVGNAVGAVVVAPALLLARSWRGPPARPLEAAVLALLVLAVCVEVFHGEAGRSYVAYAEAFLLFPLMVWAALRFRARGAAFTAVLVAVAAIWGTALGQGPFALSHRVHNLLVLQLFICVTALTGLLLAAARSELLRAMEGLELSAATLGAVREGVLISARQPDGALRIVHANEAFLTMLGRGREELEGLSPRALAHADGLPGELAERFDAALEGRGTFRAEMGLSHAGGGRVDSEAQVSLLRDARGDVTHVVTTHRDVSDAKELQARLMAAERFAAVGTLAAGVGHEINNPLAYLVLSLEAAARGVGRGGTAGGADALARIQGAQEAAERIRLIARDLKTFSRDAGDERARVDLREVVASALRMTRHALSGRARLVEDYAPVPEVLGSESRLGQVLLNLVVNAVQALPEGEPERHEVRVRTGTTGEGHAFVEVSDTGCGIDPDVLPRIFEPFFTTKANGEGTGLGLPICQQIARAHGGEVRVRGAPGQGSTFTLVLPPASAAREAVMRPDSERKDVAVAPSGDPDSADGSRRGRVLIIDDEPRLAQSMRLLLEPSHDVVIATRGSEALALVSSGQPFDVVLCDLQMPETSGMDVYAQLQVSAPDLARRLVFLSGGAYTPAAHEFVRSVPNPVLEKPVRPEALLAVVDAALS
ncbi:MASE1 domain-containing protein [Myxococcaceae bacterium GXIMD 01537]